MPLRVQAVNLFILFIAVFLAYRLLNPVRVASQADAEYTAQFRIWVGTKDTQAKEWSGKVSVSGAELVSLKGVRFSRQDRAGNDGSFQFRTKIGNLENQLRTAHPYGVTDWNDATRWLIPEGLIEQIRGSEALGSTLIPAPAPSR